MHFILTGLREALHLITHPDAALGSVLEVTLRIVVFSTLAALALGLPAGTALALGRFRGRRPALAIANAGMGLPPVLVGLVLSVLMFRLAPLGGLHLIYTVNGMIVAQTVLSLPVVIALTAASVQAVPAALLDQARALGAAWPAVWGLALREARVGILAATIAAAGSGLSEVGALILVGGNITGQTQTLATAILTQVSIGDYGRAIALGIILLGLILIVAAWLTFAQQHEARAVLRRAS